MESSPTIRRHRFRFGLRTLLAVVTLAAVGSWGYWVAWPWWQEYGDRISFENEVKGLRTKWKEQGGVPMLNVTRRPDREFSSMVQLDSHILQCYRFERATYFIYFVISPFGYPITRIELFRSPPISVDDRSVVANKFWAFVSGDRKSNPDFKYELIYSDPPATPAAK
jgi:hypothetical protein